MNEENATHEENSGFSLRAYYAELVAGVPSVETLLADGHNAESAEYIHKSKSLVVECIGKALEAFPDEQEAQHVLIDLAHQCQEIDSAVIAHRETSLIRLVRDEKKLDELL